MEFWGKPCVPSSAWALKRGKKLLMWNLELASRNNLFQRGLDLALSKENKRRRGGIGRSGPWEGRETQKKMRETLREVCRPLFVLEKNSALLSHT